MLSPSIALSSSETNVSLLDWNLSYIDEMIGIYLGVSKLRYDATLYITMWIFIQNQINRVRASYTCFEISSRLSRSRRYRSRTDRLSLIHIVSFKQPITWLDYRMRNNRAFGYFQPISCLTSWKTRNDVSMSCKVRITIHDRVLQRNHISFTHSNSFIFFNSCFRKI